MHTLCFHIYFPSGIAGAACKSLAIGDCPCPCRCSQHGVLRVVTRKTSPWVSRMGGETLRIPSQDDMKPSDVKIALENGHLQWIFS